MSDHLLHISCHAHAMLVEQVMAIHGRGSSDPVRYRRLLNNLSSAALQRAVDDNDFPVLEETAAHSLDARSQTPGASTPAGIQLSTLPQ